MSRRTIILSDEKDKHKKAILNLECGQSVCRGNIKFFNVDNTKNLSLGIKHENKEVIKIPLSVENLQADFVVSEEIGFLDRIFCAVVCVENKFCPEVVLSGSNLNEDRVKEVVEIAFLQNEKMDSAEMYDIAQENEIEQEIEDNLNEDLCQQDYDMCAKCKYRECFYDDAKQQECVEVATNNEREVLEEKVEEEENFYFQVKSQIDELFSKFGEDEELCNLVPNSKWVRVSYENSNSYYVLGLIYKNDNIDYIAYGLPAENPNKPPEDLKEYAQWFPVLPQNPEGRGYWVVYQSALSGESVLLNVI